MSVSSADSLAAASQLSASEVSTPATLLVLEPRRGWIAVDWGELWRYRELLSFLVWRDIKVRYKQTVLGAAWSVLQPLFHMVVFAAIFGELAGFKRDLPAGLPYSVWVYAALLPWALIQTGVAQGGMSLVNAQNLLTKVYFPRLFVPSASVGGALVDMLFSTGVLALLMVWLGVGVSWQALLIPVLLALTLLQALGYAYLLSALTVKYRDFRFVIPFLAQALQYLSFVMVPLARVPEKWRTVLAINPGFGLMDAYRSALFGMPWHLPELAVSVPGTILLFLLGLYYFRRTERQFADIA